MKKFLTALCLGLMALVARANSNEGKITITQLGEQKLRYEIDGRSYNSNDSRFLLLTNVMPGTHSITIYSQYYRNKINSGGSYSWGENAIYTAKLRIRPGHHIDIVINRFGKALIDDEEMNEQYNKEYADDSYYDNDRNKRNDRRDNDQHSPNYRDNRNDNRNTQRNSIKPMADQSFTSLLETLRKESFEDTRLNLAKQVADQNYFTTVQIKQVLQSFAFEDRRLDLAKYLYRNTVDRESYFQLYDVFTFSQSKDALSAYIRDYK